MNVKLLQLNSNIGKYCELLVRLWCIICLVRCWVYLSLLVRAGGTVLLGWQFVGLGLLIGESQINLRCLFLNIVGPFSVRLLQSGTPIGHSHFLSSDLAEYFFHTVASPSWKISHLANPAKSHFDSKPLGNQLE